MNKFDDPTGSAVTTNTEWEEFSGFLPVDAVITEGRPAIEWLDLKGVEFNEPFFHQTIMRVEAGRTDLRVTTDYDALLQFEKICDSVAPTGFIFHSSRCGSTLVANACRSLNGSVVIAEAPVIDKIVSRFFTDAEPGSTKELLYLLLLKAAVNVLGQQRTEGQRFFVKFACTSTLQMNRVRRIWPDVPFVFLYRDPIEVIVSNLRSIPEWLNPESNPATAAAIVGVSESEVCSLTQEEFCARAVGRFFAAARENVSERMCVLNYNQLTPDTLVATIKFLGIEPTPAEIDVIQRVSRLYSKDSTQSQTFQPDTESKQASASETVRVLADKFAMPFYKDLNSQRS